VHCPNRADGENEKAFYGLVLKVAGILALMLSFVACGFSEKYRERKAYEEYCQCVFEKHEKIGVNAKSILLNFENGLVKEGAVKSLDVSGYRDYFFYVSEANNWALYVDDYGMKNLDFSIINKCEGDISNSDDLILRKGKRVEGLLYFLNKWPDVNAFHLWNLLGEKLSCNNPGPALVGEILLKKIDSDLLNNKFIQMKFLLMFYRVLEKKKAA
jgi:hypothetical protein